MRLSRRVALCVAFVLVVALGAPLNPLPGSWPLDFSFLKPNLSDSSAAFVGVPVQQRGADGQPGHYVDAGSGRDFGAQKLPRREEQKSKPLSGAHSYNPATSKRIPAKATLSSDVYQNEDGSKTVVASAGLLNYKGDDGQLHPIDTSLVADGAGRFKVAANELKISLTTPKASGAGGGSSRSSSVATGPSTDLAAVTLPSGQVFGYRLDGAASVAPQVSGSTALYRDILPNVDIELESIQPGLKETIILKAAGTQTSFVFPLHLEGLTPRLATDGSVELLAADGTVAAVIPHGFMEDSAPVDNSGERSKSENVSYELTTVDGKPALRVNVDPAWLQDPARVFPVRVDPTLTTAWTYDAADVFVDDDPNSGSSDQNGTSLAVGRWISGSTLKYKARSFMAFPNFDSDGFVGKRITAAELEIYLTWANSCTHHYPFYVHRVTSPWTTANLVSAGLSAGPSYTSKIGEFTVADNYPACTNTSGDRTVGKWLDVPLNKETVYNWATTKDDKGWDRGLALTAAEDVGYSWKRFTSASVGGFVPKLQITYDDNTPPQILDAYPGSGTQVKTLTPQLVANAMDVDGFPNPLKYTFEIFDATKDAEQVSIATSGLLSTPAWTVPQNILKWGGRYRWQVTATDGLLNSNPWTASARWVMTTPVPQAVITSKLGSNGDKGFSADSGNYTSGAVDADVATVGPALAIERQYNSADPREGLAFGAGWSSLLDSHATVSGDFVSIVLPTGRETTFGRNSDGVTFASGLGSNANLTAVSGGYRLIDKSGTAFLFATATAAGLGLTSITDAQGRTLTLERTDGNVTKLLSASGRALNLAWADGHVKSVSTDLLNPADPNSALTWNYYYVGSQLTKVCPPGTLAECTRYSYTDANLYPLTTQDLQPNSYWRLAETSGSQARSEVLEQMGADWGTYVKDASGSGVVPREGSTATAARNPYVEIPTSAMVTSGYQSIAMWVKADPGSDDGVLYSLSDTPMSRRFASGMVDYSATNSPYHPVLYIGTDGKLMGGLPREVAPGVLGPLQRSGSVKCIDVTNAELVNGRDIEIWDCLGRATQQWTLTAAGELKLTSGGIEKCLDAAGTADKSRIVMWTCQGIASQKWYLTSSGQIVSQESYLCIDQTMQGIDNGTDLVLASCNHKAPSATQTFTSHTQSAIASNTTVADGQWHHVVLTASGNSQELFVDGTSKGTLQGTVATNHDARHQFIGAGYLGGGWPNQSHAYTDKNTGAANFFDGYLSDVAVFGRPLDPDAIKALYDARTPRKLLSEIVRPSGRVTAKIGYSDTSGAVSQVTDSNGGVWKVNTPTVAGSSQVYSAAVLGTAPENYWRLNDPAGASGAANEVNGDLARYSSTTLGGQPGTDGPFQDTTAPLFDGTKSYVEAPAALDVSGSFSWSAFVRLENPGSAFRAVASKSGAKAAAFTVAWQPSTSKWYTTICTSDIDSPSCPAVLSTQPAKTDGSWTHLAVTYDAQAKALKLFVNGISQGSQTGVAPFAATGSMELGRRIVKGVQGTYFTGRISEVGTYRSALSDAQVLAQYQAADPMAMIGLVDVGMPTRTVGITDPTQKVASQVFNLYTGQQVASVDPLGDVTRYGYDGVTGYMDTMIDPNENVTQYKYDARGNVIERSSWYDYNDNSSKTTAYFKYFGDPTQKYPAFDVRNDMLTEMRDGRSANGADNTYVTKYEYEADGSLKSETDALGRVTTNTYYPSTKQLHKTINPGGGVTENFYDARGDMSKVVDPAGLITEYTYDAVGHVRSQKVTSGLYPNGLLASFDYDNRGQLERVTRPTVTNAVTGNRHTAVTTMGYNADGQTLWTTTADTTGQDTSRTVRADYNDYGQKSEYVDEKGAKTTFTYDAYGQVATTISPDSTVVATAYDAVGRLLNSAVKNFTGDPDSPSSPQDVSTTYTYDRGGRLTAVRDAMGYDTLSEYSDNNLLTRIVRKNVVTGEAFVEEENFFDKAGHVIKRVTNNGATTVSVSYDRAGQVEQSTLDPNGLKRITAYAYWPDGQVKSLTQKQGANVTPLSYGEITYDVGGRPKETREFSQIGPDIVAITTYDRDQTGLVKSVTDANGNVSMFGYDEAGNAVLNTGPEVTVEEFGKAPTPARPVSRAGYNTFGEQTHTQSATGNDVVTSYNARGQVTSTKYAPYKAPNSSTTLEPVVNYEYDEVTGELTRVIDPLGNATQYTYDKLGRVAKVIAPNEGVTRFSYDLLDRTLSTTDAMGATESATYDYLDRQLTATSVVRQTSANHTTTFGYAASGWLNSMTSPDGVKAEVTSFNAAGQPVTVKDGAGSITTSSYDGAGRPNKTLLADGTYTTTAYDLAGRATVGESRSSTGTLLRSESIGYDKNGNTVRYTDGRGTAKIFAFDALNRLASQTEPLSATDSIVTTFGYDAAGRPTRFTDGRGNAFFTKYNSMGLVESRIEPATSAHPGEADRSFTFGYDAAGRLASEVSPGGVQVTHTRDAMGQLRHSAGSGAEAATVDRTFTPDLVGRLREASSSAGVTTFDWDDRGLLTKVDGASGTSSFTYTGDGLMKTRTDAAGTTAYGYDTGGRLSSVSNPGADVQMTLGYDNVSQLRTITHGSNGNKRWLDYDGLHRLVSDELKTPSQTSIAKITYTYDANDNLKSKATTGFTGSATTTYAYDLANRLVSQHDGTTQTDYAYDKSGNRVMAGAQTFTYNERNQLVSSPSANTTYEYTARGTMRRSTTGTVGLDTLSDAFGQVSKQFTSESAFVEYKYDGLGRVSKSGLVYTGLGNDLASDGVASYTRDPSGGLLGIKQSGSGVYAWTDQHTDVVGQFTATGGSLAGSSTYDPWGKSTASGTNLGSLGYQQEFTEQSTGRVNMHARWYDPSTGAFDSRDTANLSPVPASANANRYTYGNASPLNGTDPSGHDFMSGCKNPMTCFVQGFINYFDPRKLWDMAKTIWNGLKNIEKTLKKLIKSLRDDAAGWEKTIRSMIGNCPVWDSICDAVAWAGGWACGLTGLCQIVSDCLGIGGKRDRNKCGEHVGEATAEAVVYLIGLLTGGSAIAASIAKKMLKKAAEMMRKHDLPEHKNHGDGDADNDGDQDGSEEDDKDNMRNNPPNHGGSGHPKPPKPKSPCKKKCDPNKPNKPGKPNKPKPPKDPRKAPNARNNRPSPADIEKNRPAKPRPSACAVGRPGGHSFDPATPVLMADGTVKPISEIKVGEKVAATDPTTGETTSKPVTALHINVDNDLVNVVVSTTAASTTDAGEGNGDRSTRGPTETILQTTEHHPFWDATVQSWVDASKLTPGQSTLTGPDGQTLHVVAVTAVAGAKTMHDLTVANVHTYHVLAGAAPILVHNNDDDWDPQSAPGGQRGAAVSIKQLKMALGRAGMSVSGYDIVHVPQIATGDGLLAYGYSPHDGGTANPGPRGRPMIQISDIGLYDMDTAVATIFHEIYHHQNFIRMGVRDFGGKESVAERYGQAMLRTFNQRTGRGCSE